MNKLIQRCTDTMRLRECIRNLQMRVESPGGEENPFRRQGEGLFIEEPKLQYEIEFNAESF